MTAARTSVTHLPVPLASAEVIDGEDARTRAADELCIPVWEEVDQFLWFPGRSLSAVAHWWITDEHRHPIGDWRRLTGSDAYLFFDELDRSAAQAGIHADYFHNTYMALPEPFNTTLLPRFVWERREIDYCNPSRLPYKELVVKWVLSAVVAQQCGPEEFLVRLEETFEDARRNGWYRSWIDLVGWRSLVP